MSGEIVRSENSTDRLDRIRTLHEAESERLTEIGRKIGSAATSEIDIDNELVAIRQGFRRKRELERSLQCHQATLDALNSGTHHSVADLTRGIIESRAAYPLLNPPLQSTVLRVMDKVVDSLHKDKVYELARRSGGRLSATTSRFFSVDSAPIQAHDEEGRIYDDVGRAKQTLLDGGEVCLGIGRRVDIDDGTIEDTIGIGSVWTISMYDKGYVRALSMYDKGVTSIDSVEVISAITGGGMNHYHYERIKEREDIGQPLNA